MDKIIFFCIVYFSWCSIYAGCDEYDLKFWEPDPSFVLKHEYNRKVSRKPLRRTIETTKSNKANFKNMRLGHYFPKYDVNIGESALGNEARRSDNLTNGTISTKHLSLNSLFSGTTYKYKKAKDQHKNLTNAIFNDEMIQRSRFKSRPALRSTRYNLMEQTDPTTTAATTHTAAAGKKAKTTLSVDEAFLNPYAITHHLRTIITSFEKEANITLEIIGRTAEYKDIVLLKISEKPHTKHNSTYKYLRADDSKYMDETPEKKIIFIVHGLTVIGIDHVDSLSSPYDFETLLGYYIEHLPRFDLFVIPMANPDGFSKVIRYTGWNKNNSPQTACPGVALDRNFDVAWNNTKTVSSCSLAYPGTKAFSEPETQAIRNLFHHYGHKIHAYIHVHSGTHDHSVFKGDAVLYPKGYTSVQSDDDRYIDLKGEIEESLKNASFKVYSVTVDTLHQWYGQVSGSSVDYASTVYGIPYALEFVMQPYEHINHHALAESWSRIIGVVFDHAYKYLQKSDKAR